MTNERVLCHWIILLNGTSCSGKTTLSGALQRRLSLPRRPFLHIEADRFLPHLPDDVGDGSLAVPMHRALHRAIASFAGQGFDLIVDGVLPYGHPDPTRQRTRPRTAPDGPAATTRQASAATSISALGPYLEAASSRLLNSCRPKGTPNNIPSPVPDF